jgi:hypothetical protein
MTLIQMLHMASCHITASIPLDRAEELAYLVGGYLNGWRFVSQADFSNSVPGVVILIRKVLKASLQVEQSDLIGDDEFALVQVGLNILLEGEFTGENNFLSLPRP